MCRSGSSTSLVTRRGRTSTTGLASWSGPTGRMPHHLDNHGNVTDDDYLVDDSDAVPTTVPAAEWRCRRVSATCSVTLMTSVGPTPGLVNVHWFDLAALPWADAWLEGTLSSDERARAERFRFPGDRRRFVRRRGALRMLLGSTLGTDPAAVMIQTEANGRPVLAPEHGNALRFNPSSSGDVAVCATSADCAVGVDVERVRSDFDLDDLARRFFSAGEFAQLRSRSPSAHVEAFFSCWTLKEAFVKARGDGLRLPLDQFDVDVESRTTTGSALLATRWDPSEASSWCLRPLDAPEGHTAAVAVAAPLSVVTVEVIGPEESGLRPRAHRRGDESSSPRE